MVPGRFLSPVLRSREQTEPRGAVPRAGGQQGPAGLGHTAPLVPRLSQCFPALPFPGMEGFCSSWAEGSREWGGEAARGDRTGTAARSAREGGEGIFALLGWVGMLIKLGYLSWPVSVSIETQAPTWLGIFWDIAWPKMIFLLRAQL